jgi:hypothetical protein
MFTAGEDRNLELLTRVLHRFESLCRVLTSAQQMFLTSAQQMFLDIRQLGTLFVVPQLG